MKTSVGVVYGLALRQIAAAGQVWSNEVLSLGCMHEADFQVYNYLKANVTNVKVYHNYGNNEPSLHNWDRLEPGQASDTASITFSTGRAHSIGGRCYLM